MDKKSLLAKVGTGLVVILLLASATHIFPGLNPMTAFSKGQAAEMYTGYYNLLGYEGIPTLGYPTYNYGPPPAVADYVSTHCRYINIANTTLGHYYLRYTLDLPNDSTITKVALRVADFSDGGSIWAYLRTRPWNSRDVGTTKGFVVSPTGNPSDHLLEMSISNLKVDNQVNEYWIDVSPKDAADPGQLCVYGIQVTYVYYGAFLPLLQRGG
jgi:hypothetical protein